jgi:hypothetical protein
MAFQEILNGHGNPPVSQVLRQMHDVRHLYLKKEIVHEVVVFPFEEKKNKQVRVYKSCRIYFLYVRCTYRCYMIELDNRILYNIRARQFSAAPTFVFMACTKVCSTDPK